MTKYLVIDEAIKGSGDTFEQVFDTLEEANKHADLDWYHLTRSERKNRHIYVVSVTEKDLCDWAIDEDGTIDWTAYKDADIPEGAFDSNKKED